MSWLATPDVVRRKVLEEDEAAHLLAFPSRRPCQHGNPGAFGGKIRAATGVYEATPISSPIRDFVAAQPMAISMKLSLGGAHRIGDQGLLQEPDKMKCMRSHWPELIGLPGTHVDAPGQAWIIRHADVLEDQRSSRLALLLDLEKDTKVVSARLLFPAETHAVEHSSQTSWILDALKAIIGNGRLRHGGIYSIG